MASPRAKSIVRVLAVCLVASSLGSLVKMVYGWQTNALAFVADGIHSLFDSSATIIGILSVIQAAKPPDAEHPYGHQKFETIATLILGFLLMLAGYEVSKLAYHRLMEPETLPIFSIWGIIILTIGMCINLGIAQFEKKKADELGSSFLAADSLHNKSDFLITVAVLVSALCVKYELLYVDAVVAIIVAAYLVYLAIGLLRKNINPLVDKRVLDPNEVERVAQEVSGVLHCHAIRSRGQDGAYFLDLNIHLSGDISLNEAHAVTHQVEDKLKQRFPSLVDVIIHTEPHEHPPCSKC